MLRRGIPTAVAIGVGILVLVDFFLGGPFLEAVGGTLVDWAILLSVFALFLGVASVLGSHLRRIAARDEGWPYSLSLLIVAALVLAAGLSGPAGPQEPLVAAIFTYVQAPLQASIFALLVFYMASALYRTFRVRSISSLLMVAAAIIVLLGQLPQAASIWEGLPGLKDWVLGIPATAGARGILIGVALGTVATGLRIVMGIDRPYSE
ncbi:MAG: hypothetical protein HYX86_04930 [Chloroflexi bacterium]|nr:hypothetical protein [Chloroflexota bacterium]